MLLSAVICTYDNKSNKSKHHASIPLIIAKIKLLFETLYYVGWDKFFIRSVNCQLADIGSHSQL